MSRVNEGIFRHTMYVQIPHYFASTDWLTYFPAPRLIEWEFALLFNGV